MRYIDYDLFKVQPFEPYSSDCWFAPERNLFALSVYFFALPVKLFVWLAVSRVFSLREFFRGVLAGVRNFTAQKLTIQYPFEHAPISFRFKGEHVLRRYSFGDERCIVCKLCEAICPALAITIDSVSRDFDGSRRASRYDLDTNKCIYCGFCEISCPVSAIFEGPFMDMAVYDRIFLLKTKSMLLERGDYWEVVVSAICFSRIY